ncbi:MT-A70-domain-containing protein [Tricharina praecox]|uniref:MT-A70-domain-containing protein n=1 Tax=Tricharina praecox TaxID=43433 RepID=UPI0022207B42|nr:MT-A70-domain-containing protein [Tricharina praecox]KAI5848307.1 MT-A70-domain-containing protein [Tricharina praecox]
MPPTEANEDTTCEDAPPPRVDAANEAPQELDKSADEKQSEHEPIYQDNFQDKLRRAQALREQLERRLREHREYERKQVALAEADVQRAPREKCEGAKAVDTATASEDGERGCGGIAGTTATAIDKPEIDEIDKYRKSSADSPTANNNNNDDDDDDGAQFPPQDAATATEDEDDLREALAELDIQDFERSPPTVTIIDIPRSHSSPLGHILRSSSPPAHPFPQPTSKRPQKPDETHQRLLPRLRAALAALPPSSTFHAPRHTAPPPQHELDFHGNLCYLTPVAPVAPGSPLLLSAGETILSDVSDLYLVPITNPHSSWTTLTLSHPSPPKRFHIPPHSSFLLGPLSSIDLPAALGPRELILLDPPWPNKSAQRSGRYSTADRFGIVKLLRGLRLQDALVDGALLAVWITNATAVRRWLNELLDGWGCTQLAEWVWVKVTGEGRPVVNLEDAAGEGERRPYEVLVIARRGGGGVGAGEGIVRDRVLVGVPDFHSRKPCVKALLGEVLPVGYRAAEIFGRALTEGWYTVGDEAIKWNWEGHWVHEREMGEGEGQGDVAPEGQARLVAGAAFDLDV